MKKKIIYVMILTLLCMAVGCGKEQKSGILLSGNLDAAEESEKDQDFQDEQEEEAGEPESQSLIYVQVNGAVAKPGVYALAQGSRIFQAVELAGGVTESADTRNLNQAEVLTDGQMIYVMNCEEAEAAAQNIQTEVQNEDGRVNLNTATEEELMTLPGIGEAKAKSILAWREENGSFTQIEDLMKIDGIKDGVFSKIKDSVKVE